MNIKQFFTKEEAENLLISTLVITFVLSYPTFEIFFLCLVTVLIAFVLHELAHKFLAIKFHCATYYEMWPIGLLFSLAMMFVGVKILAPGAVVIKPYRFGRWGMRTTRLTVPETGIIALSGPAVNLFFALIFALIPGSIAGFVAGVNAELAFFNLLPIPPLDGSKVAQWKAWLWFLLTVISFILMLEIFA